MSASAGLELNGGLRDTAVPASFRCTDTGHTAPPGDNIIHLLSWSWGGSLLDSVRFGGFHLTFPAGMALTP